jgi:hypothetical protein
MSEAANIIKNKWAYLNSIIMHAQLLEKHLKPVKLCENNEGRRLIFNIIILAYCTKYLSHISTSTLEYILDNTIAYFATGLYDTDKITGNVVSSVDGLSFDVRAWVYTPDTHNDAGEWFHIYTFGKSNDAHNCITMLKEIESELKRLN